jgi:cysteine dioxygenase
MSSKLDSLVRFLDTLHGPAEPAELTSVLEEIGLKDTDLAEHIRFADAHYQRNLVHAGRWYHLWVLCWKNGQRSPIHDHRGSGCVVQVVRGTLTQTLCEFAPNGLVKAVGSDDFPAGSMIISRDSDMHQVSNLQPDDADLVTLHVYSPPLLRMGTYSLTDRGRGEEIWIEGGGGI